MCVAWVPRSPRQSPEVWEAGPTDVARTEGDARHTEPYGGINTAYIERLHATCRERLAALTRRGRALARHTLTLRHGMYLIGTIYNFGTPHESLRDAHPAVGVAGVMRTPAMAAGITHHCRTVQELLSFHGPPSRWTPPTQCGRPSHALQRLVERWCS